MDGATVKNMLSAKRKADPGDCKLYPDIKTHPLLREILLTIGNDRDFRDTINNNYALYFNPKMGVSIDGNPTCIEAIHKAGPSISKPSSHRSLFLFSIRENGNHDVKIKIRIPKVYLESGGVLDSFDYRRPYSTNESKWTTVQMNPAKNVPAAAAPPHVPAAAAPRHVPAAAAEKPVAAGAGASGKVPTKVSNYIRKMANQIANEMRIEAFNNEKGLGGGSRRRAYTKKQKRKRHTVKKRYSSKA